MGKVFIEESTLTSIGDAIRAKTGKSDKLTLDAMVTEIGSITTGGGGDTGIPEEAFTLTGDCSSMFSKNKWAWFINMYGNRITTNNISNATNMFFNSPTIEAIPFDLNINLDSSGGLSSVFNSCQQIKEVPLIKGNLSLPTGSYSYNPGTNDMFGYCYQLREIPDNYFDNFMTEEFYNAQKNYTAARGSMFHSCYSLRKVPTSVYKLMNSSAAYSPMYSFMFASCRALDEVVGLPVCDTAELTSDALSNTVAYCYRLKRLTFATNEDGTPKVARWKQQTLNLSSNVGYGIQANQITDLNSGITVDKEVTNLATYNALKDDADWFTTNQHYSRYNHDSAVETIYSLPDTSAYLASKGGTNTIKFRRDAGKNTDGGAIRDITSEEEVGVVVAAATAKGWTVAWVT